MSQDLSSIKTALASTITEPQAGEDRGTQQHGHVPPSPEKRKRFSIRTFRSLKYRDYRILWISILFMSAGQWMEHIALNWLVYQMTDSALMLGAINGARAIPFLIVGPWAGVAADRFDRKKLMWMSQAYVMVLTAAIAGLIISGYIQVWHLFAFTFLNAMGWSVTQPVRQTLVPNLVPKEELINAVALQSAGFNSTRVLGPAAAGLIIGFAGPGWAFAAKAIMYLAILVLVFFLKVPPTPSTARETSATSNFKEGFKYIWGNQAVFSLIILALVPILIAFPAQSLMPIFARDVLGFGPEGYGVMLSVAGIGALAGTLGVASLGGFRFKGRLLMGACIALGVSLILFALASWLPTLWENYGLARSGSLILMVFVGGFQMIYMSLNNTLLHLNITDDMRGRVMSIYMLDQGMAPLGSLLAGVAADSFGAPLTVVAAGILCLLLAIFAMFRMPIVRRLT